jgi:copper chaperone
METLKFKTTIKCSGCVAKVTPLLNETVGQDHWEVDIQSSDKVLTIASEEKMNPANLIKVIESLGYKAERFS